MSRLIKIGQIVAPHGIKGMVKINLCLENPRELVHYMPIYNQNGQVLDIQIISFKANQMIATIKNISDRNQAESMRGTNLFINRETLPPISKEQYYYCDLIGLTVLDETKTVVGVVKSVENYGASDILVVETKKGIDILVAFTKETVLSVDLENKTITVAFPPYAKEEE